MNSNNEENMNQESSKKIKKPFYKEWWFIAIVVIIVITAFNDIKKNKTIKVEWKDIQLGTYIPEVTNGKIDVAINSSNYLILNIKNISLSDYNEYKKRCIEMGYTVDSKEIYNNYQAFNKEGYELNLYCFAYSNNSDEEYEISLKKPEELKEFEWPTNEISLNSQKSDENAISKDDATEKEIEEKESTTEEPKQEESKEEQQKQETVSYSTNDKNSVKNGNAGVYAYRNKGEQFYNYYIIDFNEGYVYFFTDGNGSESCDKVKITSGDLNSTLIITYHDGSSTWQEGLHFKYKKQPEHLIVEDHNHFEFDFYSTDLSDALKIRDKKTITNY